METLQDQEIINEYLEYIGNREYACVAARAAVSKEQVQCMIAGDIACPFHDGEILQFLYNFIDNYRKANTPFHSAAIIFKSPVNISEEVFENLFWQRLQSLSDLDARQFKCDPRINPEPHSPDYSFSLKEEAFFIIGLHAASSRAARQFKYPTLVFNPHNEFVKLRTNGGYERMKKIVRTRDISFSGSVNPMLDDFGKTSEVYQYSGKNYDQAWECPLKNHHGTQHHSTP
ncbi:MAG: guanitoxin biosynthesis heme-dependent pre-guanitoxin N-hydroxylase GntA [Ferruginibacter sp.]